MNLISRESLTAKSCKASRGLDLRAVCVHTDNDEVIYADMRRKPIIKRKLANPKQEIDSPKVPNAIKVKYRKETDWLETPSANTGRRTPAKASTEITSPTLCVLSRG